MSKYELLATIIGALGLIISVVHGVYALYKRRPRASVVSAEAYNMAAFEGLTAFLFMVVFFIENKSSQPLKVIGADLSTQACQKSVTWSASIVDAHGMLHAEPTREAFEDSGLSRLMAPYDRIPCLVPANGASKIACVFYTRHITTVLDECADAVQKWLKAEEAVRSTGDHVSLEPSFAVDKASHPQLGYPRIRIKGKVILSSRSIKFDLDANLLKASIGSSAVHSL